MAWKLEERPWTYEVPKAFCACYPVCAGGPCLAHCVVCNTEIRDDARFCPACGAEQPRQVVAGTDADPLMGKVVARKFRIEKLLGVGGMGKVYKARQLSLDKAVVVKVLHDQFREDPQLVQRFQREAKAASRLNHPNSIQIIDFGQDEGGVVFMAMEFLQGQDLFSLLKKEGALPAERICRIMVQVCSALAEAHEQNVIHRDLKPENIMVEDRRGQRDFVKVLDFGIAKIQDPDGAQALTQAGMVCGTPEYMSPEQARGLQLDARSDIYALGVVMYQLAVGELPFQADTPIGIVTKHILEKPVAPRQKRADVDATLETIILKAMEKEAARRFNTVAEMAEQLEVLGRQLSSVRGGNFNEPSQSQPLPSSPVAVAPHEPAPPASHTRVAQPTPTRTAPTPHNPGGAAVELAPPAPVAGGSGARGLKVAALSFVGVLGVAVVAMFALGILPPKSRSEADAGPTTAPVVDAGSMVAVPVDAGLATPLIDRPARDAGSVVATVDAGAASVVDAGSSAVVKHDKPDAGIKAPPPPPPPPPKGCPAAAAVKLKQAIAAYKPDTGGDCDASMPLFVPLAQKYPSCPDPLKYMAMCYGRSGPNQNKDLACKAITKFHEIKGTGDTPAGKQQRKIYCP